MKENYPVMARIGYIYLTWRRYRQKGVLEHKITLKQLYVLEKLMQTDFMYPADIAVLLYCDRPTVSVIIKNMEKYQWIVKEKDPVNKKRILVKITGAGLDKLKSMEKTLDKMNKDFIAASCFTQDELKEFNRLLGKLEQHVGQLE